MIKKTINISYILMIFFLIYKNCYATENINRIVDPIIMKCDITPEVYIAIDKPTSFEFSNNLRRKSGDTFTADGIPIKLMGRVLDHNCTPISNAIVKIWHTNNNGLYQFDTNKKRHPREWDMYFLGSGTATTDNLGYYHFLTIYPAPEKDDYPSVIHFQVQHKEFLPIQTTMFFQKENQSKKDKMGLSMIPKQKRFLLNSVMSNTDDRELTFEFNIVLKGINKIYQENTYDMLNTTDPVYYEDVLRQAQNQIGQQNE